MEQFGDDKDFRSTVPQLIGHRDHTNSIKIITAPLSIAAQRARFVGFSVSSFLVKLANIQVLKSRTMYTTSASNGDHSKEYVDLRSDTVTRPCAEMRGIMAKAIVGDDVYGEDPTINALEERCAKLFGKESALFVATGTMGNLIAVMGNTARGDDIIVGKDSHIHRWEQGNYAQFGAVSASTVEVQKDGTLKVDDIRRAIRSTDDHMPTTKLICLENTHNFAGGKAISLEYITKVRAVADEHNLKLHLDGARIYNAAVKLNTSVAELCKPFDTVQMCFSKGLGAPVGSIVVGSKEFIKKARRIRKALGGGWRQGGVLAAAAMYALDIAEATIREDQRRAMELAKGLSAVITGKFSKFVSVDSPLDEITNMVLLRCKGVLTPRDIVAHLKSAGILVMHFDDERVRMVMNRGVDDEGVARLIQAFKELLENLSIN
ncbi:hypothetical protein QR680_001726 [Steinernema hermaphroditum]|uniref:Aromatic amino acid beta-eliminating lyase/threonine aldolase domain-containing protein n=1 Tax=Steinernema hermaphroditum TaxID=289476 RepID=A0AA39LGK6_9BILA|nr:hypothetical protein QR680_001726 [Steinernema hermaphroditum]